MIDFCVFRALEESFDPVWERLHSNTLNKALIGHPPLLGPVAFIACAHLPQGSRG